MRSTRDCTDTADIGPVSGVSYQGFKDSTEHGHASKCSPSAGPAGASPCGAPGLSRWAEERIEGVE